MDSILLNAPFSTIISSLWDSIAISKIRQYNANYFAAASDVDKNFAEKLFPQLRSKKKMDDSETTNKAEVDKLSVKFLSNISAVLQGKTFSKVKCEHARTRRNTILNSKLRYLATLCLNYIWK